MVSNSNVLIILFVFTVWLGGAVICSYWLITGMIIMPGDYFYIPLLIFVPFFSGLGLFIFFGYGWSILKERKFPERKRSELDDLYRQIYNVHDGKTVVADHVIVRVEK